MILKPSFYRYVQKYSRRSERRHHCSLARLQSCSAQLFSLVSRRTFQRLQEVLPLELLVQVDWSKRRVHSRLVAHRYQLDQQQLFTQKDSDCQWKDNHRQTIDEELWPRAVRCTSRGHYLDQFAPGIGLSLQPRL